MESGTKDEGNAAQTGPDLKENLAYLGARRTGAELKQDVENVAQFKDPQEPEV